MCLRMRRTVPCFHVKTAAPIIRPAAINSVSAGGNTNSVSNSNGPRRPLICASTGTCAVPLPGSCGRIPPDIPCGEAEYRCVLIVLRKIQRFILRQESPERVETKRKTCYRLSPIGTQCGPMGLNAAYGEETRRRIKSFCDGSFYIPMQKNNTVSIRMWSFMRIYQRIQL